MKKFLIASAAIGLALSASSSLAQDVNSRINKLEQEIQLLKRQQEVTDEKSTASAEKSATVELGKKGLNISSPDKKYQLGVHGVFQFDSRNFLNDETTNANNLKNEFIVRRARPIIDFKAGNALLYFMPDFAGTTSTANNTKVFDAYAEYKFSDAAKVRFGKFKPPVGLEQLQSDPDTLFMERGYVSSLIPTRDVGLQVAGQAIPDYLDYQLGVFDGTTDGGNADGDLDDRKDLAARLFAKPFANSSFVPLQGFGVGVGGTIGEREGRNSTGNSILGGYSSPGQQSFFSYATGAHAYGEQWRLSPQAYWYSGNKGIVAEYGLSNIDIRNNAGTTTTEVQNKAWNIAVSYVLTGEDINFAGGVKPTEDFNPSKGTWGAWEVVARAGGLEVDDAAFNAGLATITTSAKEAQSYGGGLNWYLSDNLKLLANYNYTEFDGGATAALGGDRPEEHAVSGRVQVRF